MVPKITLPLEMTEHIPLFFCSSLGVLLFLSYCIATAGYYGGLTPVIEAIGYITCAAILGVAIINIKRSATAPTTQTIIYTKRFKEDKEPFVDLGNHDFS